MTTQLFTAPGLHTLTVPPNVRYMRAVGLGGGGGSGAGQILTGPGQGGHGAAAAEGVFEVTPGATISLNVGAGGTAGVAAAGAGGAGDDSWFLSNTTLLAKGGGGGHGANGTSGSPGLASACIGTVCYSGGKASAFSTGSGGAGGGGAGNNGQGGDARGNVAGTGGAGTIPTLAGGAGANRAAVLNGAAGPAPGGGAASGTVSSSSNGAKGGNGLVWIEYEEFTEVGEGPIRELTDMPEIFDATSGRKLDNIWEGGTGNEKWARLAPHEITLPAGRYFFTVPRRVKWIEAVGAGAQGGQGGAQGGTSNGGLGGNGGTLRGRFHTTPGVVLYLWVGKQGGNGFDPDPTQKGGEPGGAGCQENIYTEEHQGQGACGGGYTAIWWGDELDPFFLAGAGGGGGAHGTSGAANAGGVGGVGGGKEAGNGGNGNSTTPSLDHGFGFGAGGGTQSAGGTGGIGSTQAYGSGTGYAGVHLGGGTTFRLGAFGDGDTVVEPKGGGGGGGWFGGGGGGNGSVNLASIGGGGAGGGGSSFVDPARVANAVQSRGDNDGDGYLTLTFWARYDWEPEYIVPEPDPPAPPPVGEYVVPRPTGGDDHDMILAAIAAAPDGATIEFPPDGPLYLSEDRLEITGRSDLTINCHGSTIRATTTGYRERSHWRFVTCDGITLNDPDVWGANPNAGTGDSAYVASLEAQHAYDFLACTNCTLNNPSAHDVYGDFVYLQNSGSTWCDNIVVNDCDFHRNGRQGMSVVGGRNFEVSGGTMTDIRRSCFDFEPNTTAGGAEFIHVHDVTLGAHRLNFVSSHGAAGSVHDIVVEDCDVTNGSMRVDVLPPSGRRTNFTFTGNTSVSPYGTGDGTVDNGGSAMIFQHCDGITVTGNTVALQNGRHMAVADVRDCTDYTVSGNTITTATDGQQVRVLA